MVGFVNISNTCVINSSGSFAFSIPRVHVNNFDALYTFKATYESAFSSSLYLVGQPVPDIDVRSAFVSTASNTVDGS